MELFDEDLSAKACVNISVIVNDNIKDVIINNLKTHITDTYIRINHFRYDEIYKFNDFRKDSNKTELSKTKQWIKKMKTVTSVILLCIDWQHILDTEEEKELNFQIEKHEQNTRNEFYSETNERNQSNKLTSSHISDDQNNKRNDTDTKDTVKDNPKPTLENPEFMSKIDLDLIRTMDQINEVINKRKKKCKIILLAIFPEHTKNTQQYIKHITLCNSEHVNSIFVTSGLSEIHTKIQKLESLLKSCIGTFFKQHIISYERKCNRNVITYFIYNFKKAYILEMLGKYDEGVKIYVSLLKTYYENLGKDTFTERKTFIDYIIFLNSISSRIIFNYLNFDEVRKSINHIYLYNRILFLSLMKSSFDQKKKNQKAENSEWKHLYNVIETNDFFNYVTFLEDNEGKNEKRNKLNEPENSELIYTLYENILNEYLYHNLISYMYFYFFRIIKNMNLKIHDVTVYSLYCCFCIYNQIKALKKRNKLINECRQMKFMNYFDIPDITYLYDFLLHFLIDIFHIVSKNQIFTVDAIVVYYLALIYYEKKNYMLAIQLIMFFFDSQDHSFILNCMNTEWLSTGVCNVNDFFQTLQKFKEEKKYILKRNSSYTECFMKLLVNCLGSMINYEFIKKTKEENDLMKWECEQWDIQNFQDVFIHICFEYLNLLIKNKKENEQMEFTQFLSNYFAYMYKDHKMNKEINVSISNVFIDIHYLVQSDHIQMFVQIKNESNTNFKMIPFISFILEKKSFLYELHFSTSHEGVSFFSGELIHEGKSHSFIYDYVSKMNNDEDPDEVIENIKSTNEKQSKAFLLQNNMSNLYIPIMKLDGKKKQQIIDADIFLKFPNKIVKLKITTINTYRLKMDYIQKINENHRQPKKENTENDKKDHDSKEGIVFHMCKSKEPLEIEWFRLKERLYLNKYQNYIFLNKFPLPHKKLLTTPVNYYVYANNHILNLNEYNPSFLFFKFSKRISEFELSFSFHIPEPSIADVFLLTQRENHLSLIQLNPQKCVKLLGKAKICTWNCNEEMITERKNKIHSEDSEVEEVNCTEASDESNEFDSENSMSEHTDKESKETNHLVFNHVSQSDSTEENSNYFFFEIEGNTHLPKNKKGIKKIYGKSNFTNESYLLYKRNKENTTTIKRKKETNIHMGSFKNTTFFINKDEQLICIPIILFPKNSKFINIHFDFSFKSVSFEDTLGYCVKFSVEPSLIPFVIKLKNESKNTKTDTEENTNILDNKIQAFASAKSMANETGPLSLPVVHNYLEKKQTTNINQYYLYIYNNNRHSIKINEITNGRGLKNTQINHKCTFCDIIETNENTIQINYQFVHNQFFFPLNIIFKHMMFTLPLGLPNEERQIIKEPSSSLQERKKSKIKIELIYSRIVRHNESFVVESVITNETNITEEIVIYLFDKNKIRKKINQDKHFLSQYKKQHTKLQNIKMKGKKKLQEKSESEKSTTTTSSEDFENLLMNHYSSDEENENTKEYLVSGVKSMKNILMPFQTIRLKWSFIALTYGVLTLPSVIVKRKYKIKYNTNVFSSDTIELFVI